MNADTGEPQVRLATSRAPESNCEQIPVMPYNVTRGYSSSRHWIVPTCQYIEIVNTGASEREGRPCCVGAGGPAPHLEQLLEVGVIGVEVEPVLAPLRNGAAVKNDNVEVGVQQQDAVRRY